MVMQAQFTTFLNQTQGTNMKTKPLAVGSSFFNFRILILFCMATFLSIAAGVGFLIAVTVAL